MKKTPLQFEVGKFYKRRDGRKCQVLATENPFIPHTERPLVVRDEDGLRYLNRQGRVSNATDYPSDIVGEWVAPAREAISVFLHRADNGGGVFPSFVETCHKATLIGHRSVELMEGEFDDPKYRPEEKE
jgi:hypothetical protein